MEKEIGTLEAGKYADLLIVDGDPLADIRILQDGARIVQVFKGGQPFKAGLPNLTLSPNQGG